MFLNFVVSIISPLYNGRWFYWLIKQGYQTKTTYCHMYQTNYITYIKLEKPTGQSSMDNPETRKMLGTRHRTNTKNKKNQHRKDKYRVDTHNSQKINHRCEPRCSRRVGSSCFFLDTRNVTHGQASDRYAYV